MKSRVERETIKVTLTAGLVLLAVIAEGGEQRQRTIINGAEFFQLVPGSVWTLRNEAFPDRVTTVSVRWTRGGTLAMHFDKNHPDTYHGGDGTNNNLTWFVTVGAQWIHAGNSNGDDAVGDAYPDDLRFSRDTGLEAWRIWLQSLTPGLPACFLAPSGDFTVPSEKTESYRYFARYSPTGGESWSEVGTWRVRWDLVEPDVLRIRFDESYAALGDAGVFEDWFLRRSHGLIAIQQWHDTERTRFRRRISDGSIRLKIGW